MVALNLDDWVMNMGAIGSHLIDALGRESPFWSVLDLVENSLTHMMPIIVGLYLLVVVWKIRSKVIAFLLQLPESDAVKERNLTKCGNREVSAGWLDSASRAGDGRTCGI